MAMILPEESKFERDPSEGQFPSGTYVCDLEAVREVGPSKKYPDSGNRLVFDFAVSDGPYKGKRAAQFVSKKLYSNPKQGKESGLVKLARQLGCPDPMKGFDPDQYIGKQFNVTVELTGTGDDARCWVRFVTPATPGGPAASPPAGGPPPRRGTTNAGKPGPAFYWLDLNPEADPVKVEADKLRAYVDEHKLDARTLQVCPDGASEYKALVDFDSSFLF